MKRKKIMRVTATEFKTNMGKYIDSLPDAEIFITRNGREVAKVTAPDHDRAAVFDQLAGILPHADINEKELKDERLSRQ